MQKHYYLCSCTLFMPDLTVATKQGKIECQAVREQENGIFLYDTENVGQRTEPIGYVPYEQLYFVKPRDE
jgi:hypothetical protein